jgi:hypothetical protein
VALVLATPPPLFAEQVNSATLAVAFMRAVCVLVSCYGGSTHLSIEDLHLDSDEVGHPSGPSPCMCVCVWNNT